MQESESTPAATHLAECPFTSLVSSELQRLNIEQKCFRRRPTSNRLPITLFLGDMLGRLHLWRRCGQSRLTFKKEQRAIGKGMNEVLQRALAFTLRRQVGRLTSCLRGMLEQGLGEAAIRKNLIAPLPSQLIRLPSSPSVVYAEWLACFTSQLAVNAIEDESDPFADLNMKCFAALVGHHALVTCATIIPEGQIANFPVLITSGWDQRLCFWRLPRGNLVRAIEASMGYTEGQSLGRDDEEAVNKDNAKENAILGLDYHVESRTLAYCSANSQVYLQTFGKTLAHFDEPVRILRGHSNEVNAICWAELETSSNPTLFSASEDEGIRFWFHGEEDLQPFVNAGGSVTNLHWDSTANLLLASVENVVKYDVLKTTHPSYSSTSLSSEILIVPSFIFAQNVSQRVT
ncbi:unnamed protein product [Dibothriocephalus latus]|uniref:Uncharacterized protein n=1 Tax=Dibothriocephalus latus TaxID=60516 RepID=A0A3P7NM89_DIBLA|nr:unnamed protein product [Dibothriocephalus latus]